MTKGGVELIRHKEVAVLEQQHGLNKHQNANGVAGQQQTQHCGGLRFRTRHLVVVGNGHYLQVVKERQQNDVQGLETKIVEDGQSS